MITVRMAQMVMTATVRYPVPGGSSQSRSLKMIMATYSAIVCIAQKAVVPHSTTTRRRMWPPASLWLPRQDRDQCNDGSQLDAEQQHHGGLRGHGVTGSPWRQHLWQVPRSRESGA
jgi:hypothetical protein